MSFCSFSKEFTKNSYTLIENQFITKYMPLSDGFTVKVYLYGLYLCQSGEADFDLTAFAKVLNSSEENVIEAFEFWEDYDVIRILSKLPFAIEYLPIANSLGKPKTVRYDKYSDFNKEIQNKMQSIGKFVSYKESIKYMQFLQENDIEQQAFLLIAQYCIDKKGSAVTQAYIINKAKKFISQSLVTYQQVEKELSGYNIHEKELFNIFTSLNTFKKPEEGDYTLYDKWTNEYSFSLDSIIYAAKTLKHGSMESLDMLLSELYDIGKNEHGEMVAYLSEREILSSITFKIARKLSVKINSPQTYIDEFVEKWYNKGYDEETLCNVAVYCTKVSRNTFVEMDSLIEELYRSGTISNESVNEYLSARNAELKLLVKIKSICNTVRITSSSLSMITVWHQWNFTDSMILEATKRSASTVNPVPYMNKILSDWKRQGIFNEKDIEGAQSLPVQSATTVNPIVKALDDKADRERYYENLKRNAQAVADRYIKQAETNPDYVKTSSEIRSKNIELAKAKVFNKEDVESIQDKLTELKNKNRIILASMNLSEEMLLPKYSCTKCNDSGFLPNGKACDCYNK